MNTLPTRLVSNGWVGGEGGADGRLSNSVGSWVASHSIRAAKQTLLPETAALMHDWQDRRVGWGVVLADNAEIPKETLAIGADAPEPIRELLERRDGSCVLRYVDNVPDKFSVLRRYYVNKDERDLSISSTPFGVDEDRIPKYLLLCGAPTEIPWELQYALNTRFAVGRLDLDPPALAGYVRALLSDWEGSTADSRSAIVWATEHGHQDISGLMKRLIARPLFERFKHDDDLGPRSEFVGDNAGDATTHALLNAISRHPGLIVTTSHGATGPVDDPSLPARLGAPVDDAGRVLDPSTVTDAIGGAIWYSHACCSGGSSAQSLFAGLTELGSGIDSMLSDIASLGSRTAPMPRAVLSAPTPARAFIGHVEPTFDWTIEHPATGQPLADGLVHILWDRLYQGWPIGYAFETYYEAIGTLATQQVTLRQEFDRGNDDVVAPLLESQLEARDRASLVLFGDPTVSLDLR